MPSGVMVRFLYYKGPVMGTNPRPGNNFCPIFLTDNCPEL